MDETKIYRISFSQSLIEMMAGETHLQCKKVRIVVGEELQPGQSSRSGLYAICKKKSGWPLRVSLFKEATEIWADPSRTMHECWVSKVF